MNRERFIVNKDVFNDLVETGSRKFKLVFEPENYIRSAIETLNRQLSSSKSHTRKQKLRQRIDSWSKELEILEGMNKKEQQDEKSEADETTEK
jgi:hypothetical protein